MISLKYIIRLAIEFLISEYRINQFILSSGLTSEEEKKKKVKKTQMKRNLPLKPRSSL